MPRYRMIHVDHYMSKPDPTFDDKTSEISGKPISKVPVIRIFGADTVGRKICIHVHGFYPYIAIQNPDPQSSTIIKKIVDDIEKGLLDRVNSYKKSELRRDSRQVRDEGTNLDIEPDSEGLDQVRPDQEDRDNIVRERLAQERRPISFMSNDQKYPIHRIESHKTFNYYGYHHKDEDFLKMYLYNPKMVKQLAFIFEDCRVLARFIPVFWAHLPYILLFFIDNNLRGMQFIDLDQIYWRSSKSPTDPASNPSTSVNEQEDPEMFTTEIEPISTCELEGDIRYEWILNRRKFGAKTNDDALRELWMDDQESSHGSSLIDPKLPLFNLERDYIQQLCEAYRIDHMRLDLDLDLNNESNEERPTLDLPIGNFDSDDSIDLMENCDDNLTHSESEQEQIIEDEFSDDDDDSFMQAIIKVESENPSLRPNQKKKERQRFSENSLVDGLSVVSSTTNVSRSSLNQQTGNDVSETVSHEYQYLCMMSMELHASSRANLRPNPAFDAIESVFYCIRNDTPDCANKPRQIVGAIVTDPFQESDVAGAFGSPKSEVSKGSRSYMSIAQKCRSLLHRTGFSTNDIELNIVDTELELIMTLVELVRTHDPEILLGYEMEQFSWGYVLERSNHLNIDLGSALSRISDGRLGNNSSEVQSTFVQPIMFTGRMVFSTWRIIRHDIHLNTCSYERIHEHALGERVPCFNFDTLTKWYTENRNRWRVLNYYLLRCVGQMRILDKFDLIAKVSELARVYGTQFIDVITRGSQIGIESMMLRLAKLQNMSPLSPTPMQRHRMKAPEALPLVMEPDTNIYYDPVAVLDFQSLYPSVVIAYNYCYSTCLGRVIDLESKERHQFGASYLKVDEAEMSRLLEDNGLHISPNGVAFVKKRIRHGVLPKMLSELIVTRAMVKEQMKKNMRSTRPNRRLQRILDHRQHGLKMMANTTYGYTGASYTGRMPCVEIADSIVSKGRETLERAIELVEGRPEWGAKVIYGDTDSMFILFKGVERSEAFQRSFEMVEAISKSNPHPIKMKFEKIYQPCVLQTKKRYCGFKFESPEQSEPEFEAKGIETVRRDCCPAAARMLEMALRIQFTTRQVDEVRKYVQHQFTKIMSGKLSNVKDFIFARQYKQREQPENKAGESIFVPVWQIGRRLGLTDPRSEPRVGERVPYVIVYGEPRTPLVNQAKTPMELLDNLSNRINADYYITKIICPTLNRVFCTLGVDTHAWYKSMPHRNVVNRSHYLVAQKALSASSSNLSHDNSGSPSPSWWAQLIMADSGITGAGLAAQKRRQATMSQYFSPSHCPVCAKSIPTGEDICDQCHSQLQASVVRLSEEITHNQRKLFAFQQLCQACSSLDRSGAPNATGDDFYNPCISYDCQNLFRYHQAKLDALNSNYLAQILKNLSL